MKVRTLPSAVMDWALHWETARPRQRETLTRMDAGILCTPLKFVILDGEGPSEVASRPQIVSPICASSSLFSRQSGRSTRLHRSARSSWQLFRTPAGRRTLACVASAISLALCAACPAQAPSASTITGSRRYTQFCAGCHGADGKGGDKAASLATSRIVISRSDAELFRIVRDGTPQGMPPFTQIGDANIAAVVRYLRVLEQDSVPTPASAAAAPPGDARAGRALFFGKAGCSACHLVHGEGGFIAPNLTTYARNRSAQSVLSAVLNPDAPLVSTSRVATVTTAAGRQITGVLRNEDAFDLALQTQDGRYHFFSRSELSNISYSDHSLMPRDYGTRLSPSELSDVVAFLIASSREPRSHELQGSKPEAGSRPQQPEQNP